jgi:uncharacterized protein (TIGR02271 family)
MISADQLQGLSGKTLYGSEGDKLGRIETLYVDREDGQQPTFVTVHTGLFGTSTSFVPVAQATLDGDRVVVPYTKSQVSDAPRVESDGDLEPEEESRLYRHYGLTATDSIADRTPVGHDTSGPTTDDAMTRSEEQLHVGTEKVETGRARLRKYVVTEQVQTTVPVSHEEVRIEREPITEGNLDKALDGPAISEEEHEVVLTAERPVVAKETVPVERVRLETETVTEQAQVTEDVRKEQIATDGVYPADSTTGVREDAPR